MPVYCYKCFDCNHYEEIKQKFEDEAFKICPVCKKENFKRVIRNVNIVFKGSGFHITDYSKKSTISGSAEKIEEKKVEENKIESTKPESKKTDTPNKTE